MIHNLNYVFYNLNYFIKIIKLFYFFTESVNF